MNGDNGEILKSGQAEPRSGGTESGNTHQSPQGESSTKAPKDGETASEPVDVLQMPGVKPKEDILEGAQSVAEVLPEEAVKALAQASLATIRDEESSQAQQELAIDSLANVLKRSKNPRDFLEEEGFSEKETNDVLVKAYDLPTSLRDLMNSPMVENLSEDKKKMLQGITDNPVLDGDEKMQQVEAKIQEFEEEGKQKVEEGEIELTEQQEEAKETIKDLLDQGERLPQDDTPEAEKERESWRKKVMELLSSDDAKSLYKNASIMFALGLLSLIFTFIKIHVGKIQK